MSKQIFGASRASLRNNIHGPEVPIREEPVQAQYRTGLQRFMHKFGRWYESWINERYITREDDIDSPQTGERGKTQECPVPLQPRAKLESSADFYLDITDREGVYTGRDEK